MTLRIRLADIPSEKQGGEGMRPSPEAVATASCSSVQLYVTLFPLHVVLGVLEDKERGKLIGGGHYPCCGGGGTFQWCGCFGITHIPEDPSWFTKLDSGGIIALGS